MKYREYNDYELLYMVNEMSEEAVDILYEKYKPIIIKSAKKYYSVYQNYGIDINDFILEGYTALDKAIKKYETLDNKDIKFTNFLILCIERNMKDFVRKIRSKRYQILNDSIYYEDISERNDVNCLDVIKDEKVLDPLNEIINKEFEYTTINNILNKLKGIELKVFKLKLNGFKNEEISKVLDISLKCVTNAITRIRKKNSDLLLKN